MYDHHLGAQQTSSYSPGTTSTAQEVKYNQEQLLQPEEAAQ